MEENKFANERNNYQMSRVASLINSTVLAAQIAFLEEVEGTHKNEHSENASHFSG